MIDRHYLVLLFFPVILMFTSATLAQTGFERVYGAVADSNYQGSQVIETPGGDYAVLGTVEDSLTGTYSMHFFRTDSSGNPLWEKYYTRSNNDRGHDLDILPSGNYFLLGSTRTPPLSIWLIRTNPQGDTLSTTIIDGGDHDQAYHLSRTFEGNYLLTGRTRSSGPGNWSFYSLLVDTHGNVLRDTTYGGTARDEAFAGIQTADSGFVFAGRTRSFGAGDYDIYIVKTNYDGDTLWTRTFGQAASDEAYFVQQAADSSLYIVGREELNTAEQHTTLIKLAADGTLLWQKYPQRQTGDRATKFRIRADSTLLFTGYAQTADKETNMLLMATDWAGDTLWTRTYGGHRDDMGSGIRVTADNGIILSGQTEGFGRITYQTYLVKTDSLGQVLCDNPASFRVSDTLICEGMYVQFTNTTVSSGPYTWWIGDSLYAGFQQAAYFSDSGMYDIALAACQDTAYGQVQVAAPPVPAFTYDINADSVLFNTETDTTNITAVHWMFGDASAPDSVNFNPLHVYDELVVYYVVLTLTNDFGCQAQVADTINLLPEFMLQHVGIDVNVAPNPMQEQTVFYLPKNRCQDCTLYLRDGRGRLLRTTSIEEGTVTLRRDDLPAGMYFYQITSPTGIWVTGKLAAQ